jgi:hypothetical protein
MNKVQYFLFKHKFETKILFYGWLISIVLSLILTFL